MAYSLKGKNAIVTGAGSGINLAYAKKLLEAGTNVLIADMALQPEAEKVFEQYKDQAVFQKTDVTSWAALEAMFKTAQDRFGNVDIVCPGAGIFEPPWSSFWHPPGSAEGKDDIDSSRYKLYDINLTHPTRVAQMAISHFLGSEPRVSASNPKRIIFIASIAGEIAFLGTPLYHASKWGVMGLVHSLAPLGEHCGIRIGCVAPGIVRTKLWFEHEDKKLIVTDQTTGQIQESWITPEEVADAMMALTKDDEVDNGKGEKIPITGGTILEVAVGKLRSIPMLNNTGPPFGEPGMIIANMEGAYTSILTAIQQPGWGKF